MSRAVQRYSDTARNERLDELFGMARNPARRALRVEDLDTIIYPFVRKKIADAGGGGGGSLSDGDYGDISVSGGGTALTIDANAVSLSKMAQLATSTILGRITAGLGNVQALTATDVRTIINVANGATANAADSFLLDRANHTGTQAQATITSLVSDLALKAPLASPTLSGVPAAPTAADGTNTTQIATTAFVQAAIALLLDSAPGALDTLNELAAAMGDDPNFATTVTNALATKLNLSGGNMTGLLVAMASAAGGAGLRLPPGADPTSPVDGDIWAVPLGLKARINSATKFFAFLNSVQTFTSKQTFAPSTTGGAMLNVEQGVAPSAPVDGDVWTEAIGLFARISGATLQMATLTDTLDEFANPVAALDFNQQQTLQFVIENRTSDPGSPVTGQMWLRVDL